jgi:hypothetical protein
MGAQQYKMYPGTNCIGEKPLAANSPKQKSHQFAVQDVSWFKLHRLLHLGFSNDIMVPCPASRLSVLCRPLQPSARLTATIGCTNPNGTASASK